MGVVLGGGAGGGELCDAAGEEGLRGQHPLRVQRTGTYNSFYKGLFLSNYFAICDLAFLPGSRIATSHKNDEKK